MRALCERLRGNCEGIKWGSDYGVRCDDNQDEKFSSRNV